MIFDSRQPPFAMRPLSVLLAEIESLQLVRRLEDQDPTYFFKHALVQDSAQATLLKHESKRLNQLVGETLERLAPEKIDENAARLAQYFDAAGNDAKALTYTERAGDAAARVYANAEATGFYTRALIQAQQQAADATLVSSLYLKRGRQLELGGDFAAALGNYAAMQADGKVNHAAPMELAALVAQCQIRCTANGEFNPELGEPLSMAGLQLARQLGDRAAEAKLDWILANLYRFTDRLPQARAACEQALAIARELNLREQMAYALNDLTHIYGSGEERARVEPTIQEAIELWLALDNKPMLGDAYATASYHLVLAGDFDGAIAYADKASELTESIGNLWGQSYSRFLIGTVYWMRGEPAHALEVMQASIRLGDQAGFPLPKIATRADLALVYGSLGAYDQAVQLAEQAAGIADASFPDWGSYVAMQLATIHLLQGAPAAAAAVLERTRRLHPDVSALGVTYDEYLDMQLAFAFGDYARALELGNSVLARFQRLGLRRHVADTWFVLGKAEYKLHEPERAFESLTRARAAAEALQARQLLWQILAVLADVEQARGNSTEALLLRDQARTLVEYIAAHAPPEFRESYLNQPSVRNVLRVQAPL